MAEEKDDKNKNDTFKWLVGSLIALLAAGGGIAALVNVIRTPPNSNSAVTQVQNDSRQSVVSQSPDNSSSRPSASPKPNKGSESLGGSNNENAAAASKIECKVEGAVYDFDKNSSPMPNVRVYLTDDKHPDIPIAITQPNGIFTGDCSQIPPDNFPKKVKIVTFSKITLTENELPVTPQGRTGLTLYVSESNTKIAQNRMLILKQIQMMPKPLNPVSPDIYRKLANKS